MTRLLDATFLLLLWSLISTYGGLHAAALLSMLASIP